MSGTRPFVALTTFIAEGAIVRGDVSIGKRASVSDGG